MRWVKVEAQHTISWSIQPNKKSMYVFKLLHLGPELTMGIYSNFGIFKHPGNNGTPTNPPAQTSSADESTTQTPDPNDAKIRPMSGQNDTSTAQEELKAKGFIPVLWHGKCEAEKVTLGTYPVPSGCGGMYGLIFDNTFSRQVSKTATIVILTYASNAPPNAPHHMSMVQGGMGGPVSPGLSAKSKASDSVDSLHSNPHMRQAGSRGSSASRGISATGRQENENGTATYIVGVLQKRRRKRGQGYARRFFSLDFATCTLSYYYNRNSSALRGAIPLSLAAIAADARRKEISIDSGAEVWHLKAGTQKDFDDWTKALQKASNVARGVDVDRTPTKPPAGRAVGLQNVASNQEEDKEWEQVEALVSRIVGTRDAVRRLSADTAPRKHSHLSPAVPPEQNGDYFGSAQTEKRSFWKRKSSAAVTPPVVQRNSQLAVPTTTTNVTSSSATTPGKSPLIHHHHEEHNMHQHCSALRHDLDAVLSDFSALIARSKRRRFPPLPVMSRNSFDSFSSDEFYDAEDDPNHSHLMNMDHHSEAGTAVSDVDLDFVTDVESLSSGSEELGGPSIAANFPTKPKSFDPLPIDPPRRRRTIPPAAQMPPSLIAFLRKNVGKDLSTISMHVSANEPVSLLQRVAEQFEYASLLDSAASHKDATQRLLNVSTFAISQFSAQRAKERAIRKPFNPLLGETYELIRSSSETPGGFRLLVEKVSHRPVRLAMQADSANWSFSSSPAPTQKFWGKSLELNTDGRVRIALRLADGNDELYSFNIATVFLRNVVVGEKYVEPVGTMTVINETSGAKATIEFKQKGMFGGRSEDVSIETYDSDGTHTGFGATGMWTSCLRIVENGKPGQEIWRIGNLVDNPGKCYGLTTFAAGLNEITDLEKAKLPPTDSRLRVDQRAAEEGDLEKAEEWKVNLEEGQRRRRREMEERGEVWCPRWFTKVENADGVGVEGEEEVWKLKGGKDGYWEERGKGKWEGVEDILAG